MLLNASDVFCDAGYFGYPTLTHGASSPRAKSILCFHKLFLILFQLFLPQSECSSFYTETNNV